MFWESRETPDSAAELPCRNLHGTSARDCRSRAELLLFSSLDPTRPGAWDLGMRIAKVPHGIGNPVRKYRAGSCRVVPQRSLGSLWILKTNIFFMIFFNEKKNIFLAAELPFPIFKPSSARDCQSRAELLLFAAWRVVQRSLGSLWNLKTNIFFNEKKYIFLAAELPFPIFKPSSARDCQSRAELLLFAAWRVVQRSLGSLWNLKTNYLFHDFF